MIGGLTVSTLITMLFIPTLYAVVESRIKKSKDRGRGLHERSEADMKMVMIAYNEAIDDEVMEVLNGCAFEKLHKDHGVYGKGARQAPISVTTFGPD